MERFLGLPPNASTHGAELDSLLGLVHWFMLFLFVGWGLFFLYALLRFRKGRNPVARYEGAKGHFSTYGEAAIVVVEVLLLVAFAVPIWARRVNAVPREDQATVVRVVAEQFAWNVHYPGKDGKFGRTDSGMVGKLKRGDTPSGGVNPLGLDPDDPAGNDDVVTLNQLHLPIDKPVIVKLSTKDVIHSFSLPVMRVKQDAIPGQVIPVYFQPNQTGNWEIACAQLCGLSHYRMRGFLVVESRADYEKWLIENGPKPAAAAAAATPPAAPAPAPAAK